MNKGSNIHIGGRVRETARKNSLRGILSLLAMTCILTLWSADSGAAGMFLCRSKSGTMEFTNVPNSPSCKPVRLPQIQYQPTGSDITPGYHGSANQYDGYIRQIARRYRVDPPLIKAIIHTESDFDHRAVSSKGAQGLMQLMPATARELRVADPFNPRENIDGGTRYFRQMMDNFNGNLILSLAAYNAGPGLVRRTGGVPRIPETLRYVNKVLKQYKHYKNSWNRIASLD